MKMFRWVFLLLLLLLGSSARSVVPTTNVITSLANRQRIELPSFKQTMTYLKSVLPVVFKSDANFTITKQQHNILSIALSKIPPFPSLNRRWTQISQRSPYQRLASIPVYFLGNSQGSPYLQDDIQSGRPEQRIVTYFLSYDDMDSKLSTVSF